MVDDEKYGRIRDVASLVVSFASFVSPVTYLSVARGISSSTVSLPHATRNFIS